jgi:hypothetical protein
VTLSPHFTLAELTTTNRTSLLAQNREEVKPYLGALTALCATLLEPIRMKFGPVFVHSGFRGPSLNAATFGASKTSQHLRGEAADFHVPGATLEDVMAWVVKESGLKYGQIILEGRNGPPTWIHLSLGAPYRAAASCQQALVTRDGATFSPYRS